MALALCAFLAACGGGGGSSSKDDTAPTATIAQTDLALGKTAGIRVTFSESMNTASLRLGGSLGDQANVSWSQSAAANDTLTITPRGGSWTSGPGTLTIAATDPAGNALAPTSRDYVVRLDLQTFDAAAVVIGQADFASSGSATTANGLSAPYGNPAVAPDGRLFVGDYSNNRVLGFASVPEVNGASATLVLGAADFTTPGAGGTTRSTLGGPQQVAFSGNKFIVAEFGNNRISIYNTAPADSSAVPDVVLGQPDFTTSNATTCTPGSISNPETVAATPDGKLIVTDSAHHRVLIWNSIPTQNGALPDLVLGQGDFVHCADNDDDQDASGDPSPSARTLNYPAGVWSDGKRLVVVDENNNRVLIWNSFPTGSFVPADVVLGQASMTASTNNDDNQDGTPDAAPSARTISDPYDGVASNGIQLAVADSGNNRVLVWNTFPTTSFQPADLVLGQGTFQRNVGNDDAQTGSAGTPTARVLSYPTGVLFDRDRLIVADDNNNRLLVFKSR